MGSPCARSDAGQDGGPCPDPAVHGTGGSLVCLASMGVPVRPSFLGDDMPAPQGRHMVLAINRTPALFARWQMPGRRSPAPGGHSLSGPTEPHIHDQRQGSATLGTLTIPAPVRRICC